MALKRSLYLIPFLPTLSLGACSTIVDGTSQEILINTNPSGADCEIERSTPGTALVSKTKDDIMITCRKDGFNETTVRNKSRTTWGTLGNVLLGGAVGWGIDSATGADNKYSSPVNIELKQKN